jgi:hypothetical protein
MNTIVYVLIVHQPGMICESTYPTSRDAVAASAAARAAGFKWEIKRGRRVS